MLRLQSIALLCSVLRQAEALCGGDELSEFETDASCIETSDSRQKSSQSRRTDPVRLVLQVGAWLSCLMDDATSTVLK
jgi:hypothetical protein